MFKEAKKIIKEAEVILITAGAGMGVDSGLPDFRGNEGFWKAYPAVAKLGYSFAQMANPTWFKTEPKLAWAFYGHRLNLYRETTPHNGFKMLLNLVKEKENNYFIFTSNVDGQFQKAGFDEDKIYEVHGSIHHFQCAHNCTKNIYDAKDEVIEVDMEKFEAKNLPICKNCGNVARPNIMMFNDWEFNSKRDNAQETRYNRFLKQNKNKKAAIIEIGAGSAIPTVRMEGEHLSQKYPKTKLIRINPQESEVILEKNISISSGAKTALEILLSYE